MITADKILSEHQLSKLLKRLRSEKDKSLAAIHFSKRASPREVRVVVDYFLFALLAHTGLRISEALNLRWSDIHADFLIVRAEVSKNGRRDSVYFGPKTRSLLDELFEIKQGELRKTETDSVFSFSGKLPSRSYAHTRFKYWISQAGLPSQLSLHSLRHTYGTICLDNGLSLTFVRDQLRHSNIAITSQYLHLTKANRDRVKDLF